MESVGEIEAVERVGEYEGRVFSYSFVKSTSGDECEEDSKVEESLTTRTLSSTLNQFTENKGHDVPNFSRGALAKARRWNSSPLYRAT